MAPKKGKPNPGTQVSSGTARTWPFKTVYQPMEHPHLRHKKKSGKFRLLHDLRAVNNQMEGMGPLQPGLPNPSMIPRNWDLLIIDLKDCFFYY